MANFNTYQTRNLYVVKAVDSSLNDPGDVYMGSMETGEIFFKYMNGDGQLTRTDLIKPQNIVSLKKTAAADMNIPIPAYAITLDTDAVTLANSVGKTLTLSVNFHQIMSYDDNDFMPITVAVTINDTNKQSTAAFLKDLAKALVAAKPKWLKNSYDVYMVKSGTATAVPANAYTADATGIVLVPTLGAYRRGVLSKEFVTLSFISRAHGLDDVPWMKFMLDASDREMKTVAAVNSGLSVSISPASIPSVYTIADLEYFTFGERGDDKRLFNWPHNYEPTYLVDLSKEYDVVSIEFFWQGSAENVQKSPRMIQFACEVTGSGSGATSDATTIYGAVKDAMDGKGGSGSGA